MSTDTTATPAPERDPGWALPRRRDLIGAAVAIVLVTAAVVWAKVVANDRSATVTPLVTPGDSTYRDFASTAPLLARWMPHVGIGTPLAVVIAAAVVLYGPTVAQRLPWRRLLALTWAASFAWILSLALIDGWHRGVEKILAEKDEYLYEVPRITDIPATLRTFTDYIVDGQIGSWTTHVSGHPPGALLVFVWLDRIGLSGGGWAGMTCILIGSSAGAAVLVAMRALAPSEALARRAAPFLVLAPTAIWIGVSADGMFTGVVVWGIAALAVAAARTVRYPDLAAVAAGVLLGFGLFLSYGLTLMAVPAVLVLVATRSIRPVVGAVIGALAVTGVFLAFGFWWFDGYELVKIRYWQGIAQYRPFAYWGWANLASAVCALGLAVPAVLPRVLAWPRLRTLTGPAVLVLGGLLAIAFADISTLSKAETERIWLPFYTLMLAGTAFLPRPTHRFWLIAQAVVALAINHLLLTNW